VLPTDPKERKNTPVMTGVIDYFPRAIASIARVSKAGNDQHNPGLPLGWSKGKSTDHADTMLRHAMERFGYDTDGQLHAAKMAWRALAFLETLLEAQEAGITYQAYVDRLVAAEKAKTQPEPRAAGSKDDYTDTRSERANAVSEACGAFDYGSGYVYRG